MARRGTRRLLELFSIASGSLLSADSRNLDSVLDDLLTHGQHEKARVSLTTYYLGVFPAADYADSVVNAARRYV
jgi:hypothetical protein